MAISVYTAYKALKELTNKDQRGFITPQTFNAIAQPAQMMVFNDMLDSVRRKKRIRQGQVDGGFHLSATKRVKEDLSIFAVDLPLSFSNGVAEKPYDMGYCIGAELSNGKTVAIVYDENKIRHIVNSPLAAPTTAKPILLVSNSLQIYPSVAAAKLRYYKTPKGIDVDGLRTDTLPTYAYTTVNSIDTYDPINSTDFELPEYYLPYLLIEMGRMIGLNLRDRDVLSYSQIAGRDNDLMVDVTQG